jgi:hypothetical protein
MLRRVPLAAVASLLAACSSGEGEPDGGDRPDGGEKVLSRPGGACAGDADCAGPNGRCITQLPGGYCIREGCTPGLNHDCGEGSRCHQEESGNTFCVESCVADSQCDRREEGYRCRPGATCWWPSYVAVNPGKAAVGAPCTRGGDCETDRCIPATGFDGFATGYAGGYCSTDCANDGECPSDARCFRGSCRKRCTNSGQCRGGYACIQGSCLRDPATVPLGAACTKANERTTCGWGHCLTDDDNAPGFPQGYCTVVGDCNPLDGSGCGSDGECFAVDARPTTARFCLKRCEEANDCRGGYECNDTYFDVKLCLVATADPAKVKLGNACRTNADCNREAGAGGYCFTSALYPQGYCVAPGCWPDDEGTPDTCRAGGGLCVEVGDAPALFCFQSCTSNEECRVAQGYSCYDFGDGDAVCAAD